jgi:mannose-6-phosphate isomerase-like protein (cupin superfamily)
MFKEVVKQYIIGSKNGGECSLSKSYMGRIRELQDNLDFSNIVNTFGNVSEVDTVRGSCRLRGLLKNDDIAIVEFFTTEDTLVKVHTHMQWELHIIYKGQMDIRMPSETLSLKEKESYYINPNVKHEMYFPVSSKGISITIPASSDFPEDELSTKNF